MKFANLKIDYERESHRMRNYGDDIQIYAIQNLYKYMKVNYDEVVRITIQELFSYDGDEYLVLPITYPLYGTYKKISPKIIPIYLGLSILSDTVINSLRLREFEPIGCRDQHSFEILREAGIKAYLNGCMTLTLPKAKAGNNRKKIFIVDVCDELLPYIPAEYKKIAEYKTHLIYHRYVSENEALALYEQYKEEARLIITSRLHCAVPCLAFGIPVIYACKTVSFRSVWLQKLLPLYDIHSFKDIDWNPQPVNIENQKEILLKNAVDMISQKIKEYSSQIRISEFYEDYVFSNYEFECMRYPIEYIKKNWDQQKDIKYVIWGITQTAELLYQYISKNYKNAHLTGIIDLYRKEKFHGVVSSDLTLLEQTNAYFFVAVESANVMALSTFKKYNITKYALCWQKQDYKLPVDK
ncbi:polysaccharide pyruvyl transferase family protein [Lachnospiraceae bacterium 42-17]|nr:polysaccharide pyruvyl transferase family protein [Dorea sp.]